MDQPKHFEPGDQALSQLVEQLKRTEAALRRSEVLFRIVFEYALAGTSLVDCDGRFLKVNQTLCRMLGYSEEALMQQTLDDLVYEEDRKIHSAFFKSASTGKELTSSFEERYVCKDGHIIWANVMLTSVKGDANDLPCCIVHLQNITERRQIEEALRQERDLAQDYLNTVEAIIVALDPQGMIQLINRKGCEILGYREDELVGRSWFATCLPQPEGMEKVYLYFSEIMQGEANISEYYENPIITRSGDLRDIAWHNRFIRDPLGKITGVLSAGEDITERKQAIEKLRESEMRYRIVTEMTTDYIFIVDVEPGGGLKLRWASESLTRMTGRTVVEAATMDLWKDIIHPNDRNSFFSFIQHLLTSGESGVIECRSFTKYGDVRWIQINAQPRKDETGSILSFVGAIKDITQRKETEDEIVKLNERLEQRVEERTAQLQAANKELEAFTYTVSHDLRAPLRAIDGYTRILMEDYGDSLDEEGKQVCHVIRSQSQRMGELVDGLLALSHLGRSEMHFSLLDMHGMVESIFTELTSEESRQRIDFRLGELPAGEGDPTLIHQVWINLLQNALKFSAKVERAIIEVGSLPGEKESIYFVRDNGVGFDMGLASKLFGVFQRLHNTDDFEGTGVGLAIVQRIIQRHNGRVWAESSADQGAVFYFTLPRTKGF